MDFVTFKKRVRGRTFSDSSKILDEAMPVIRLVEEEHGFSFEIRGRDRKFLWWSLNPWFRINKEQLREHEVFFNTQIDARHWELSEFVLAHCTYFDQ